MRTLSLLMTGTALVFGLAACDQPTEPRTPTSAGATSQPAPQAPADPKPAPDAASGSSGANHAGGVSPQQEPSRKQEQTQMPLPGQANDHSTPAKDPKQPGG